MSLPKAKTWLEILSQIAVLVGIPLFFVQQNHEKKARRQENSMQFIMLANNEYADVFATLSEPWQKIDVNELLRSNPTPAGKAQARFTVTSEIKDRDIEKMTEFYKATLICRDASCDAELIDQFFRPSISGFYCSYRERLDVIGKRLNRPDYADDLKDYAGTCL